MELDLPEPRYHWGGREDHLEEGKGELTAIHMSTLLMLHMVRGQESYAPPGKPGGAMPGGGIAPFGGNGGTPGGPIMPGGGNPPGPGGKGGRACVHGKRMISYDVAKVMVSEHHIRNPGGPPKPGPPKPGGPPKAGGPLGARCWGPKPNPPGGGPPLDSYAEVI